MVSKVILCGISATGKTTISEILEEKTGFTHYNAGDELFAQAKKEGLVTEREEVKELSTAKKEHIRESAALSLKEKFKDSSIIDMHLSVKTSDGFIPSLGIEHIKSIGPDVIILLEASEEEIEERIERPKARRFFNSREEISEAQKAEREAASVLSVLTGAYLKIVDNSGSKEETVKEIMNVLEK